MKNTFILSLLAFTACTSTIKDDKSEKETGAAEVVDFKPAANENLAMETTADFIGYWVGWFEADLSDSTLEQYYREGIDFSQQNKINISIDSFSESQVFGHSVVANNYQVFEGTLDYQLNTYLFEVKEPEGGKYDGAFKFQIAKGDSVITGTWEAYNSKLAVNKRKFKLKKKIYTYDASNELDEWYADYSKTRFVELTVETALAKYGSVQEVIESMYYDLDLEGKSKKELEILMINAISDYNSEGSHEYYTVTEKFDDYNASKDTIYGEFASELSKADIFILRNSIFARHGYSFKDKNLRHYFDNQDWYIPVHANIRGDLTDLEKHNIEILLAYEEHAEEYYDEFGR